MTVPFVVRRRPPTRAEAEKLVEAIKKTSRISAYPVSAWLNCGHPLVAELPDGTMAGACLNDDFFGQWTEIAVLFVLEEYRGMGIGDALFEEACAVLADHQRHVMIMSNNPLVTHVMPRHGLSVVPSLSNLPRRFELHRSALTWIYDLRWWMCAYRIKEVIRKRIVFGKQTPYTYGLALAGDRGARSFSRPRAGAQARRSLPGAAAPDTALRSERSPRDHHSSAQAP